MAVEALVVRHAAEVGPEERMIGRERALLGLGVVDPLVAVGDVEVDRQHLPAAVGQHGDVVLHALAADDPVDREVGELAVGTARAHHGVLAARAVIHASLERAGEMRAVEVADDELRLAPARARGRASSSASALYSFS